MRSWHSRHHSSLTFLKNVIESEEHPGGRSPDIAIAVRDVAKLDFRLAKAETTAPDAMIGGIEHEAQGHLESILHLLGVEQQLEPGLHEGHHGRHPEPAEEHVIGEIANDRHKTRVESDLLLGL